MTVKAFVQYFETRLQEIQADDLKSVPRKAISSTKATI